MYYTREYRNRAHREIDTIFRVLFPEHGMAVREEQIMLCHKMLDNLLGRNIALCDAGVGIGKTYAYLVACVLMRKYSLLAEGCSPYEQRPVVISTSSIALQKAILTEYIPFLSRILQENGTIQAPIKAVIRKGKEHFVCDERLEHRIVAIEEKNKNALQKEALLSLKEHYDMDEVSNLKEIAETFETSYKTNLLVWDFTQNCSEVLKKQIFYTLSRIIANTSMSKAYRNVRLKSLKLLYDSCVQLNITDIGLLEMEQVETILKNFPETSQRSILGECRRDAFMQQEQIQWEANVWYLERLHLGKHRIDESKSLISISFMEVKEIQNREILQAYMKYELGITGQAVSTIVRRFVCIRNFIELLEQEKILAIHATVAEVKKYADGLRERGIQAKGFNERIFGIGHFYKFMEVKQYITRMPFRIEYFQQKEVIVHHDRSVEETVYMEILKKLYLFPERLRCMFLHLWCLGLRASEVCTLKGNAYYQQGEDYWIQVYQVKMKNYKRIPIPQALYQIMKVYLKKHEIQPEEFIFKNSRGGACLYGTFRTQMIEACRENKIANGEYLFQSHDYRHTVATMFYDSHVSLQSIRDYLGHTYEEMTRQYIDYMPQRIAKANDEFFEMQGSSLASWLKKEEKDGK